MKKETLEQLVRTLREKSANHIWKEEGERIFPTPEGEAEAGGAHAFSISINDYAPRRHIGGSEHYVIEVGLVSKAVSERGDQSSKYSTDFYLRITDDRNNRIGELHGDEAEKLYRTICSSIVEREEQKVKEKCEKVEESAKRFEEFIGGWCYGQSLR